MVAEANARSAAWRESATSLTGINSLNGDYADYADYADDADRSAWRTPLLVATGGSILESASSAKSQFKLLGPMRCDAPTLARNHGFLDKRSGETISPRRTAVNAYREPRVIERPPASSSFNDSDPLKAP